MATAGLVIGLAFLGWGSPPSGTSSDSLTLRDGRVVLGQLLDSDRRGPLLMLVRRAWAVANLPEKSADWARAEAPIVRKAQAQRRERLLAWKRDRQPAGRGEDRIGAWIDRELGRMADPESWSKSPLMVIRIGMAEAKAVDRKPRQAGRMLRLGWLSDFPDVEMMARDDLARALDGRGFAADSDVPVSVDHLLPPQAETDAQWLMRRAATEVVNDEGGRLLRYQGAILPEPAAGEAPPAAAGLEAAMGAIKGLLGEAPVDQLPGKLREMANRGRVGVVVTGLELAPDFSSVAVETTLWVRMGDRWNPAVVRSSSVRPDDLPAGAGAPLADDPQVKAVFGAIEALGLGEVSPEFKRRSLGMGAATRRALGQARGALDEDLNRLALPLDALRERGPAPKEAGKPVE